MEGSAADAGAMRGIVPRGGGGEMGARVASLDWRATPVGAPDGWPQSLRSIVRTLLSSQYPMVLTWGPSFTQFYNDAYSKLIGDGHPAALGSDIRVTLAAAWGTLGPMIERVMTTGVANWTPALPLLLERAGYREETYFSVSHAPAEDDAGRIVGMLAVCSEVTQQVIGERRLRVLRELAEAASSSPAVERRVADVGRDVATALAHVPLDVPFALLYLREGDALVLGAEVGVEGSPARLAADAAAPWPLARAMAGEAVVVGDVAARVGRPLAGGLWGDAVREAVVMPIASSGHAAPLGVLIAGVSPNRALDEQYRSFHELVAGQVSVAVRNAHAVEEERRRTEALAELDRAKTAFFSNVSHEFRTPLTLLLGPLEAMLARADVDAHADTVAVPREELALAHRNALRLLKLVNTLLEFSRVEAGRVQASFEPTDLAGLTADLASSFRSATQRAGLRLVVDCPELPAPVYVDHAMWEKVVFNLLSNAIKFTFEGDILVSLRATPEGATLVVRDTGVGIPAGELPHVFERFHQARGARARTHEGSGIGLALVRDLVVLHGGTVAVESAEGQGTTFTVTLPFGAAHLPAERVTASGPRAAATGAAAYVEEALRWLPADATAAAPVPAARTAREADEPRPRVLLADDNADMREYVTRLLGGRYAVTAVADGEAALDAARRQPPDLVLSDVMMPRLDGFALLRALRADARTAAVPVILLSARAGEEESVVGLEAGADDYLVKPFTARELLARVAAQLAMAHMRRELAASHAANAAKAQFLTTMSHELRTPLNAILGYVDLLTLELRGPLLPQQHEDLERVRRSARYLLGLIGDILEFARLDAGSVAPRLEETPLDPLLADLQALVAPQMRLKELAFVRRPCEEGCTAHADPERLRQVILNLLSNAVKFTERGGRIEVDCISDPASRTVQVRVRDTGRGIALDKLDTIFDPFVQLDRHLRTESQQGVGLGLAISRDLARGMGGDLTVASAVGEGSTFTVTLPVGAALHVGA